MAIISGDMRFFRLILPVLMVLALLLSQGLAMATPGSSCLKIRAAEMCLDPMLRADAPSDLKIKGKSCPDAVMAHDKPQSAQPRETYAFRPDHIPGRMALSDAPWKPPRLLT